MITERLSDFAVIAMHANTVTIDRRLLNEKFVALGLLEFVVMVASSN